VEQVPARRPDESIEIRIAPPKDQENAAALATRSGPTCKQDPLHGFQKSRGSTGGSHGAKTRAPRDDERAGSRIASRRSICGMDCRHHPQRTPPEVDELSLLLSTAVEVSADIAPLLVMTTWSPGFTSGAQTILPLFSSTNFLSLALPLVVTVATRSGNRVAAGDALECLTERATASGTRRASPLPGVGG
jgi:hypothetical protein